MSGVAETAAGEESRIPLTRMRKAIVRSMTASAAIPQFTLDAEFGLAPARALLAELASEPDRPSLSDVLVAAAALALRRHPRVNASFDEDAIVEHGEVNVCLAVAVEEGLLAPVIRGADRRTLPGIAAERRRLTAAATAGSIDPADLFDGTFTISNLGPFGIPRFRALVVPPQAAILAVGSAGADGSLRVALSCDHRVVDGAPAARFLADLRAGFEDPSVLQPQLNPTPGG